MTSSCTAGAGGGGAGRGGGGAGAYAASTVTSPVQPMAVGATHATAAERRMGIRMLAVEQKRCRRLRPTRCPLGVVLTPEITRVDLASRRDLTSGITFVLIDPAERWV